VIFEISSGWSSKVSVFWFDAEAQRSIERGFQIVADLVKIRKPPQDHQAKQTFKDWVSDELAAPWLAVFDNAFSGLDLRGLLPKTGGKIIITSRHEYSHRLRFCHQIHSTS